MRGIHRWPVNSPHKGPVTRKMFPFDYVIMSHPLDHSRSLERKIEFIHLGQWSSRFCAMFYSPEWTIFFLWWVTLYSLLFFDCQNLKHFSCLCDCHSRNCLVTIKRFFIINNHWVFAKSPLRITTQQWSWFFLNLRGHLFPIVENEWYTITVMPHEDHGFSNHLLLER